jgi:hypothetical protein
MKAYYNRMYYRIKLVYLYLNISCKEAKSKDSKRKTILRLVCSIFLKNLEYLSFIRNYFIVSFYLFVLRTETIVEEVEEARVSSSDWLRVLLLPTLAYN